MIAYVTGGAGFLGSHLCDRLIADGHTVVAFDNFVTGARRNLSAALASGRCTLVEADVSEPLDEGIASLAADLQVPQLIMHFASPASPLDYGRDPIGTLRVNAFGAAHLCTLARKTSARLFMASTSESYGDPLEHPQRETYWGNVNPVGMRSCYDEAKRFAEAYVTSAAREMGIDGRVVRIFNTYGPRMQPGDGRVIPNFCMSALRGEALTIYGDGSQTRSFCYVDDLIDGIVRFAMAPNLSGAVINIGNPGEFTIGELARIVAETVGVPLDFEERPLPPDDPTRRRPDITVARERLGWEPHVDLRTGLERTIAYFRDLVETAARVS
jgi:UDP-glucuronate decarboxylase